MIQHPVAGTVLITALKSWRYIAALSAAAVIVGLCLVVSSGKGSFLFAMAMGAVYLLSTTAGECGWTADCLRCCTDTRSERLSLTPP